MSACQLVFLRVTVTQSTMTAGKRKKEAAYGSGTGTREPSEDGGEREKERKREKIRREESRRLSLRCSWPLIVENDTRILVPREGTKFVYVCPDATVVAKLALV